MSTSPSPGTGAETLRILMDILNQDSTSNIYASLSKLPPQASLRLDINVKIYITSNGPAVSLKSGDDEVQLVSYPPSIVDTKSSPDPSN